MRKPMAGISVLMLLSAAIANSEDVGSRHDAISVQCLAQNKKVLPLYWQCGSFWNTDVKLPDVLVINRGPDAVTVMDVEVTGLAKGREVVVNHVADDIPECIRQVDGQFRTLLGTGVLNEISESRVMMMRFGPMVFANTTLSESATVAANESAVVLLSSFAHLTYTGLAKVDELRVKVVVKQGVETMHIACPVVFTPYQSKGDYMLPVKGDVCVVDLPMNLAQHRACHSQEFACDIIFSGLIEKVIDPGTGKEGCRIAPLEGVGGGNTQNSGTRDFHLHAVSDSPIYGRDVLAAGSGVVVDTGDKFPESIMSDPSLFSEQRFDELTSKLVPEIGFMNSFIGNYVIIDHENGEFSAYAHLKQDSIRVKAGDRVTKGQVIGAVGNTGHSSEPHLHFQLMDSKDFLTANGLPVMFSDVPPAMINQNCGAANSLCATDLVMIRNR